MFGSNIAPREERLSRCGGDRGGRATAIHLEDTIRKLMLAVAIAALPFSPVAAEDELAGTYKLVSEQRKIVDTGEIVPMPNSVGYISYGKDGRMLVLIVRSGRPKPESVEKMTDQQRADLHRSMTAYGGNVQVRR